MYIKTEGIVLREVQYRDTDKILTVLTRQHGKLTLKARGIARKVSPLKSACQLLTYSEFTIFEYRGFSTINEAQAKEMFLPLRDNIERLSLASYFAQVAEVISQEDSPNPELLSLLLNSLHALAYLHKPQIQIKAVFELRAACLAGYEPDLSGCAVCANEQPERFNIALGVLQCTSCTGDGLQGIRMPVGPGTLQAMRHIVYGQRSKLFSFQVSEASMQELSHVTEAYLTAQLERSFFTLDFYKTLLPNQGVNNG